MVPLRTFWRRCRTPQRTRCSRTGRRRGDPCSPACRPGSPWTVDWCPTLEFRNLLEGRKKWCGSGMFILDSISRIRIFPSRIRNRQRIEVILNQKIVSKILEMWSGMVIPDRGSGFFSHPGPRIRIQGSKITRSRICHTSSKWIYCIAPPAIISQNCTQEKQLVKYTIVKEFINRIDGRVH